MRLFPSRMTQGARPGPPPCLFKDHKARVFPGLVGEEEEEGWRFEPYHVPLLMSTLLEQTVLAANRGLSSICRGDGREGKMCFGVLLCCFAHHSLSPLPESLFSPQCCHLGH